MKPIVERYFRLGYGYDTFPGRSLAELNDDEWQEYLASIEEVDVFAKLRDYLVKKS